LWATKTSNIRADGHIRLGARVYGLWRVRKIKPRVGSGFAANQGSGSPIQREREITGKTDQVKGQVEEVAEKVAEKVVEKVDAAVDKAKDALHRN